ncbi:MAG: protein phosphatase 2C domain-containing protein [Proteobacteria bacterium]|nr:protein phosphatase 2C domain-containing protein [Pseudomonadota bacterium]
MTALIRTAAASEQGARNSNEDAVAVGRAGLGHYAVLADGAGGHQRGAEAAERAVACMVRLLEDAAADFSPDRLTQMVHQTQAELLRHQASAGLQGRMHCTLVALWLAPGSGHVLWTHVGDSRLYRFRHGHADMVTLDDSVVQQMVQAGLINPEQARHHPQKNQLTAALGMDGEITPHTVVRPVEVLPGDAFLLCSDGWWGDLTLDELATSLDQTLDPAHWLDTLRRRITALARPRQDNFSAVALWVGDPAELARPGSDDTQPGQQLAPLG